MFKKLPLGILLAALLVLTVSYYLSNRQEKTPSQYFVGAQNAPKIKQQPTVPQTYEITNPELTNFPGRWAIAIRDLRRKETYLFRADEKFSSASLYKLAVMYKVFDSIKIGELKADNVIADLPVKEALRLMITISDNNAAIILAEYFGWEKIDKFMEDKNLAAFDLVEKDGPTTSASATLELLDRIYNHTAVDNQSSQQMLDLLFAQTVNDRIPKYLPEGTLIAHKTGELQQVRHDAGIIKGTKGDYIFVFLTETDNPPEAAENIAQVSKKIFNALETQ